MKNAKYDMDLMNDQFLKDPTNFNFLELNLRALAKIKRAEVEKEEDFFDTNKK